MFTAQGFNLFDMDGDPCGEALAGDGGGGQRCSVPRYRRTGHAVLRSGALDSPAGQYNFLQGGNTALDPEESDTYSYGIVFTPRFAPGLSVSVDYFDIDVDGSDLERSAPRTRSTHAISATTQEACGRINRNPANGALWIGDGNVEDLNINIGGLQTSGRRPEPELHRMGNGQHG